MGVNDEETIGDSFTQVDPKEFMAEIKRDLDAAVGTDITLVDPDTEPSELVVHEPVVHNPIVQVTPAKPMTVLETEICELYSIGKSTKAISVSLGINAKTVRDILGKPHIKDFVSELINAQYTTKLEGRLRILNSIIDAKIEKIEEEHGGDMSKATNKDVVDLIITSDNIQRERTKKELGTDSNIYLQIMNVVTGGDK